MGNTNSTPDRMAPTLTKIEHVEGEPIVVGPADHPRATKLRLVVLSDTHQHHRYLDPLPAGDVLIHCGDWSNWATTAQDTADFNAWLKTQSHPVKICVAGNHEMSLNGKDQETNEKIVNNAVYLQGQGCSFNGVSFWGGPWNKERDMFKCAKAFSIPPKESHRLWSRIPNDVDILITHSPPHGVLDRKDKQGKVSHMGCPALFDQVVRACPTLHLFGHCHHDCGVAKGRVDARAVAAARIGTQNVASQQTGGSASLDRSSERADSAEDETPWECTKCTLVNRDGSFLACAACGHERPAQAGRVIGSHTVTFVNAANKLRMFPLVIDFYKIDTRKYSQSGNDEEQNGSKVAEHSGAGDDTKKASVATTLTALPTSREGVASTNCTENTPSS